MTPWSSILKYFLVPEWPVVYPESSYKIMDPVSAALPKNFWKTSLQICLIVIRESLNKDVVHGHVQFDASFMNGQQSVKSCGPDPRVLRHGVASAKLQSLTGDGGCFGSYEAGD